VTLDELASVALAGQHHRATREVVDAGGRAVTAADIIDG
jgi:hypothetical protein